MDRDPYYDFLEANVRSLTKDMNLNIVGLSAEEFRQKISNHYAADETRKKELEVVMLAPERLLLTVMLNVHIYNINHGLYKGATVNV